MSRLVRILAGGAVLAAVAVFLVVSLGSGGSSSGQVFKVELDNAFGLEKGAQMKVAGVPAGTVSNIEVCKEDPAAHCQNPLHAALTVDVTEQGFGQFHKNDVFCESRPQSLIGEYFLDCQPGSKGPVLTPCQSDTSCSANSTIPVTKTFSTIPADLLNDVMQLPYRERLTLIINELGAAVAGRSGDLQAALRRAVPALTQTDNLLNLLGNDSATINALTGNADTVLRALANNTKDVQHFIDESNSAATVSAAQAPNISRTWADMPGFLEQLRPAMQKLNTAARTNLPVINNLNAAAPGLATLFNQSHLPAFATSSLLSVRGPRDCPQLSCARSLGQASVAGQRALTAAKPTIADLARFTGPVGCDTESDHNAHCVTELGQNLSTVLHALDDRGRAVEADKRSPGGKGYTGLEALLQYVFNQALAINTYNPLGHLLAVDAFIDPLCSPYANQQTVSTGLAADGPAYRRCYAWLGPNQPGINETDPSNPGGCVPDPGGSMPGEPGPRTSARKCSPVGNPVTGSGGTPLPVTLPTAAAAKPAVAHAAKAPAAKPSSSGASSRTGTTATTATTAQAPATAPTTTTSSTPTTTSAGQAQQLLNYLMAP